MFSLNNTLKTVFQKKRRIGRGEGSNRGKNSGKGHKGQTKRAGKVPATFEGGKKSLVRRTPKTRGFVKSMSKNQIQLTTSLISANFKKDDVVSLASLLEKKLINKNIKKVRIINRGDLTHGIKFEESENSGIYLTKGVKDAIK